MCPSRIRLSVRDTGAGIPGDLIDKIFDPFFTTKPVGEGTGLGLTICHKIVEEHGGTIDVESEPEKGATFIITLPSIMCREG
jgi:signal transduction histidine kinase